MQGLISTHFLRLCPGVSIRQGHLFAGGATLATALNVHAAFGIPCIVVSKGPSSLIFLIRLECASREKSQSDLINEHMQLILWHECNQGMIL